MRQAAPEHRRVRGADLARALTEEVLAARGRVRTLAIPGALAAHEEHARAVARAILDGSPT